MNLDRLESGFRAATPAPPGAGVALQRISGNLRAGPAQRGGLLVEALVALALALVAVLALLQAEAGARATRGAAEGQVAALAAVRTALEARHPLLADDPATVAPAGPAVPVAAFGGVELALHGVPGPGAAAGSPAGASASWSLSQRAVEARWRTAVGRARVWWVASLQWQAPADRLGWLDGREIHGSRMPAASPWAAPGDGVGLPGGPGEPDASGEPLEGEGDPVRPDPRGDAAGAPARGPGGPVETPIETAAPPGTRSPGLGPQRPLAAARLDAAIRQARSPGSRSGLRPGWALQSGALRVDPAILSDASRSRGLQDWIARVIESDSGPSSEPSAPREGARPPADRPPICDLQPVGGLDPHLAWRCLGWAGAADLLLLPRTGLPTGWVLCRFRVQVPGGTVRVQAPAPRVHAWIGLAGQGCPAQAEPA